MCGYTYARCLFCTTGKEEVVVRAIEESGHGQALFPQRMKKILKNGAWIERPTALLPGYVFVYSDEETVNFSGFPGAQHVIRMLTYGDGSNALIGRDREFAYWLWRLHGRVGVMQALQVGDRIEIVDGVFRQLHGTIARMDRRRKTVRVELDTQGAIRYIWLSYEVVDRADDERLPGAEEQTSRESLEES